MTESVKYRAPRRTGSETNRYSTEIYHLRVAVDAYNLQPTEIHATYINDALDTLRSASTYFPFSEAECDQVLELGSRISMEAWTPKNLNYFATFFRSVGIFRRKFMFEILFCFLLYLKTEGYFPSQFQHKSIPEEVMECVLCVLEAVYTTMVEYDSCVGGYGMLVVDSISIYCKSRYLDRGATLWGLKILSLLVTQPKFFLEFNLCVPLTHKCENLMKLASLQDKIFYIEDAKISVQSAATNLLKSSISYFLENLRVCIAELTNFGEESNKEELVRSLSSDKYYRCSITIVCLRGLTAAVELSSIHGVESGSCVIREVFNIHDNYKSLIHILYLIFSRILPSTVVDYSKCVKNLVLPEGVLSLVLHSLQLLKCVISVDPVTFQQDWALFLSEFDSRHAAETQLVDNCRYLHERLGCITDGQDCKESYRQIVQHLSDSNPHYSNVIFHFASSCINESIRIEAYKCIRNLSCVPIRKWLPKRSSDISLKTRFHNSSTFINFLEKTMNFILLSSMLEKSPDAFEIVAEVIWRYLSEVPPDCAKRNILSRNKRDKSAVFDYMALIESAVMILLHRSIDNTFVAPQISLKCSQLITEMSKAMIHSRTLKALLCISSGLDNRSYDESSSAIVDRFSCSIIQSIVNTTIAVTAKSTNQQLSITLRNLSNQLFLDHYGDFKRNVVLQGILQQLEVLENLQLRLFGLKLLTAVLQNTYMDARFELKAGSLELNYTVEDDKMLAEMPFQVTLATMLAHCKDSQHQVRGLSFANIGLVPSHIWQHCFCENFSTRSDDVTIFNEVVNALSAGAVDGIGTVREAALKAIGEVINNCSHLFPTVDLIRASASVNGLVREIHYMQILSSACLKGCKDTKLSVRIQSSWALGNLLSTMAPTRSMILETPPIHFQLQPRPFFWFDEYWVEIANTTLALANDSEKLVATTVRCWSLLLICLGISTESDVLVSAISERMSSMIYSNKSYDVHPLCPMEFYISNHHQKHLVAMSHAFNALFWYLSRNKGIGVDENRGTAYELLLTSENYVDLILGFQCKLLKYEGLNVRLVSLHSLLSIYGAVFSPTISRIFRTSILSAENIIRLLESLFCSISLGFNKKDKREKSSDRNDEGEIATGNISMNLRQLALIVGYNTTGTNYLEGFLPVIKLSAEDLAYFRNRVHSHPMYRKIVELLVYHAATVVRWLAVRCKDEENFSMCDFKINLVETPSYLSNLSSLRSISPKMISVEIAEFYLALNKVSASETTIKELTYYSLNDDGEEAILNPVLKLKFMGIVDTSCKIPAVQDEHERSSLLESDTELDEI